MKLILSLVILCFSLSSNAIDNNIDNEDIFETIKLELMNNKNINKLEINYVYTNIIKIIESIETNTSPLALIKQDFKFIIEYSEELLDKKYDSKYKEELWLYINNHSSKAKRSLIDIKDHIFKS